jgi:signal peptidase II
MPDCIAAGAVYRPPVIRSFLTVSLPLLVLDIVTKIWCVGRFPHPELDPLPEIEVVPGFFWLHRLHNTGMAFGQLNGWKYANYLFLPLYLGALFMIVRFSRTGVFPGRLGRLAAALMVSGICGNMIDRLTRGYVVDFLRFRLGDWYERLTGSPYFASFNVADACICVAAGCLLVISFFPPSVEPEEGVEGGNAR